MALNNVVEGTELLFVNSVTATIMINWESITSGLQIILVLTAICYNLVKIYTWYEGKFGKKNKVEPEKDEKQDSTKINK